MGTYTINRCICHNETFEDILEYARKKGYSSVDELQDDKFCSCSCQLCVPYVEQALQTSQTEFKPGAFYKHE